PRLNRAVAHCFTGQGHELADYVERGLYIGITGWICDERRGQHLVDLIPKIPADRLMIETDAPYLLPRTIRPRPKSRRNEPRYLPEVLRVVADAAGKSESQIAGATTENAERFFDLPRANTAIKSTSEVV
ncbi:MAG: TatD family hydrolase, partial [Pseudomonadota bacterium]